MIKRFGNDEKNKHSSITVFKSEEKKFVKNENRINFKTFITSGLDLCQGDFTNEFHLYLINASTQKEILNESTCMNFLIKENEIKIDKNSLVKLNIKIKLKSEFIEYLKEGMDLNMIIAIDFTKSNGAPDKVGSLHEDNEMTENPYERSMRNSGEIISQYATTKMFPCFGYGAILPGKTEVSHCFSLNLNSPEDPKIENLDNVLKIYNETVRKLKFSDPTYYSKVIEKVLEIAKKNKANKLFVYNILVIMTDGKFEDKAETIQAICECADYPISIIIVGVGNSNFSDMAKLDKDGALLTHKNGMQISRDIIKFIPYINYVNDRHALCEEIFDEIPFQVVEYLTINDIMPQDLSNGNKDKILINGNKDKILTSGNKKEELMTPFWHDDN